VEPEHGVKSIGHEDTYSLDISDVEEARKQLLSLATRVAKRMRRSGLAGKTITLKVKYHDFVQITRSATLGEPTDDSREIFQTCCDLLGKTEVGSRSVRLLGISLSRLSDLDETKQLALFAPEEPDKRRKLNRALDTISERFGDEAIVLGTLLEGE
jgi:DNA polymerase-4